MSETSPYLELADKLNKWPIRTPKTKTLIKILKEIFTPEEAYLLSKFETPMRGSLSIDSLLEKGLEPEYTPEKISKILDSLYERGLMPRFEHRKTNKTHYLLLPLVIGFFEFVFSNYQIYPDEKLKRMAKLFHKYYMEGFGLEIGASNYPWSRVFPHDRNTRKEVEIKIDQEIEGKNEILPYDDVRMIIENAKICGIMPCSCRVEEKYLGTPCEHSIETCMVFDPYLIDIGMAREISKEEAFKILHKCEREGLVHISNNAQAGHFWICNCCSCSCGIMGGLTKLNNPKAFAKSNFIAAIDESKECKECMNCVTLCPMHAIQRWLPHDSIEEETWNIDTDKCIGCGVCASNCPTDRMYLKKVRDEPIEDHMINAYIRCEMERFH
ncbi:MAG: ATP-binding protein [Candidatus Hodarchaeales archaeon]